MAIISQGTGIYLPFVNNRDIYVSLKADVKSVSDAVATAASPTLTSATAAFTSADVGKTFSLSGAAAAPATTTCTTSTSTTPTFLTSVASTANISPGMWISGSGIPANTYVVGIRTANSIVEISNSATASASGVTITFTGGISGTIIGYNSATSVTMSLNASTAVTGGTYGGGLTWGSDDTAAVLAAASAATAFGTGASLIFPSGSFYCGGTGATALRGISLQGSGPGSTGMGTCMIGTPGLAADMVTLGKWGCVRDMGIVGGTRNVVCTDAYARITNTEHGGCSSDAIAMTTSSSVGASLHDVHINNAGGNGINISSSSAFDSDFVAVTVGQSGKNGMNIVASDMAITNCHFWGNGTVGTAGDQNGVRLVSGVAGCRFTNVFFETNYGRGSYASSSGCKGHSFTGCWFWKNVQQGIYFFTGSFINISGSNFWDQGFATAGGAAAIANDTGNSWTVSGNTFFDDQGTKTQTYAYQEVGTTSVNTIVGNNMQAANHKTASNLITSTTNFPLAANMATANNV